MPDLSEPTTVWGVTHFDSETGTEGGYWAVRDIRSIDIVTGKWWPYCSVLRLQDGDELTIVEDDLKSIIWTGTVSLRQYRAFTEDAEGMWIHADQIGVDRKKWARFFFDKLPCRLITRRAPWVVGVTKLSDAGEYHGLITGGVHRPYVPITVIEYYSDGSVRWPKTLDDPEHSYLLQDYLAIRRGDPEGIGMQRWYAEQEEQGYRPVPFPRKRSDHAGQSDDAPQSAVRRRRWWKR